MKVRFFKIVQYELDGAVEYYNVERPGLGYEFLWAVFVFITTSYFYMMTGISTH